MNFLVHTIIPEMYWKEYGPNKPEPTGVTYMKIVVYLAEESAVTYVDVGGIVELKPSRMRKPRLVEELSKRWVLENEE